MEEKGILNEQQAGKDEGGFSGKEKKKKKRKGHGGLFLTWLICTTGVLAGPQSQRWQPNHFHVSPHTPKKFRTLTLMSTCCNVTSHYAIVNPIIYSANRNDSGECT